ncbi:MAG: hypothetical protein MJB14_21555 [Spirochaetes bacterium]|nr:hypothetical protein [Spirochaetota bacterium]
MRLIDIDRLEMVDDHIHYRKRYEASIILMDNKHQIKRNAISFSIEYRPVGDPLIDIKFINADNIMMDKLIPKVKQKITQLDHDGVLAALHRKN